MHEGMGEQAHAGVLVFVHVSKTLAQVELVRVVGVCVHTLGFP